jgi:glutaredoxin
MSVPADSGPVGDHGLRQWARVLVLTRDRCHLCDQAIEVVAGVCAETGADYHTVDVDADPELRRRYTDQVPVTFVDGRQHDFWRVDPVRLRDALVTPRP